MFTRDSVQAVNPARRAAKRFGSLFGSRLVMAPLCKPAVYPEVPAGWPNRATRRAVKQGRESRLTGEWRVVLVQQPELRKSFALL